MPTGLVKTGADFRTTLALGVSAGDTTATLSSITNTEGDTLSNGTYSFTIDRKNASKEHIVATVTGTALSSIVNVSAKDGTETSGFANAHRKGAEVIISDWVAIKRIQDVLETGYASATTPSTDYQLATKKYVDDASFIGATNASDTTPGVVELPTQAEVDAGDDTGGTGPTVVVPSMLRAKKYHDYAADSVGSDAYAIDITPSITAYETGQVFTFKAGTANTGACTLNVDGLGAKTIKKNVSEDLVTGDILANQIVTVVYDGTNMQLLSRLSPPSSPIIRKYEFGTSLGSSSTQFDITNPAGTTFRYTYDGTGTDPVINATTFPVGSLVSIGSDNLNIANCGTFIVTGSGNNYFEITNASGVAETNKTISDGVLKVLTNTQLTWTKPSGLKYIVVEGVGGGGGGTGCDTDETPGVGFSGSGAGYFKKQIAESSLGATETVTVGGGGFKGRNGANPTLGNDGTASSFGAHATANGGDGSVDISTDVVPGGTATGGDINIPGGASFRTEGLEGVTIPGGSVLGFIGATTNSHRTSSTGYGSGGIGGHESGSTSPEKGQDGIVIVTEYYS